MPSYSCKKIGSRRGTEAPHSAPPHSTHRRDAPELASRLFCIKDLGSKLACPLFHAWHFFFFNDTATTEIYTLSLHDALPICPAHRLQERGTSRCKYRRSGLLGHRSEEHTSELQSLRHLVCRLLLEKKTI